MILFFLSSGLFLGWSLGANDAANVFGSAVGTKMVSFTRAAIIASIFVILGAVIQGAGASHTLGSLGTVSAIGGAFTVALSAAITVFWMTRLTIPVSTSQAIVGAIIGWNFYTGNPTDLNVLTKILGTWIMGPILGAVFAIILYYFISIFFRFLKSHLLQEDAYIRMGLLLVGAFSSFSLGANNIANVMGVFMSVAPEHSLNFGLFSLSGIQQLFLLGGIAISVGIFTYSRRVMETVGNGLMHLSSKSAIITVLSHSLVLFIFSSQSLSDFVQSIGLPPIPLVPVSSSQVIIGSILGLGILKGGYNIKFKVMGGIAAGWVATPIMAGIFAFFALFFVNNVFLIEVESGEKQQDIIMEHQASPLIKDEHPILDIKNKIDNFKDSMLPEKSTTELIVDDLDSLAVHSEAVQEVNKPKMEEKNFSLYFYLAITLLILGALVYFIYRWLKNSFKRNRLILNKNQQILKAQKDLAEIETKYHLLETQQMEDRLQYKNKELTTMALNLIEKNSFLDLLKERIEELKLDNQDSQMTKKFNDLYLLISQNQNLENDREAFQIHVDDINRDFFYKLNQVYPNMTKNEKRLCVYLRLDMSSKEISSLFNISPKSVEMSRYRLRKKMNLGHNEHLSQVLKKM